MPIVTDFALSYDDGFLQITMTPPVDVTNMALQFQMMKRAGGSPLATASVASGLNNASGINVTDPAHGIFSVALPVGVSSGLQPGNYFFQVKRVDSGNVTSIAEGYRSLDW